MKILLLGFVLSFNVLANDLMIYSCDVFLPDNPDHIINQAVLTNQTVDGELDLWFTQDDAKHEKNLVRFDLKNDPELSANEYEVSQIAKITSWNKEKNENVVNKLDFGAPTHLHMYKHSVFITAKGTIPLLHQAEVVLRCENQLRHQVCAELGCN
ncbi:MAG: hypothetical protein CME62_10340 [Halobacteriovoraceae bacterium]|nr:hypothetical protein [Halobacteriovoraceae bacterium]